MVRKRTHLCLLPRCLTVLVAATGAGKTTTLSILSGDIAPTSGRAYIDGLDIETEQLAVRRLIGYCPQHDALLDLLTVQEHLHLYARIKGIRSDAIDSVINDKIRQMDLVDFADKQAGTLSGGNKRKLSVAIAMIGEPRVVFLDEPSTGMDPVARRYMWDVIAALTTRANSQCSVILTTHSMEEAEALCTRIGIMVNGQLRCLGTSQHLKNRFGQGFELEIMTDLPAREAVSAQLAQLRTTAPQVVSSGSDDHAAMAITLADTSLCAALGRPDRAPLIDRGDSGSSLRQAAAASDDGRIGALLFCEWWLCEDISDRLNDWLRANFGDIELLVRGCMRQTMSFLHSLPNQLRPPTSAWSNRIKNDPQRFADMYDFSPHNYLHICDGRSVLLRTRFDIGCMPVALRWASCLENSRTRKGLYH